MKRRIQQQFLSSEKSKRIHLFDILNGNYKISAIKNKSF